MASSLNVRLSSRALSASGWVAGGYALATLIRFGGNLVMTRLLAPDMFGVMALAFTFQFALQMFSDVGLNQVAIQHRDGHRQDFLDVLWTVQVVRGALLTLIGLAIAAGVAWAQAEGWAAGDSVYAHPDLPGVLSLMAFSAFIGGVSSTRQMSQGRDLNLRPSVFLQIASQVVGLITMLAWAWFDRSVYALAVGATVAAVTSTWLSHTWLQGKPNRLAWDPAVFRQIWLFGRWVILNSMLGFGVSMGDRLLLSAFLNSVEFGLYSLAIMIVLIGHELASRLAGMVGLAALSEVHRERPHDLRRVYYKLRLPMDVVAYGGAGFIAMAGSAVIDLLYDDRYAVAGPVLQVLGLTLLMIGTHASSNLFLAVGKSWILTAVQFVRLAVLLVALPWLASRYGFVGATWGVVVSYLSVMPVTLWFQWRAGVLSLQREFIVVPLAAVGALAGWLFALPFSR